MNSIHSLPISQTSISKRISILRNIYPLNLRFFVEFFHGIDFDFAQGALAIMKTGDF
jgi:hypothetical protein